MNLNLDAMSNTHALALYLASCSAPDAPIVGTVAEDLKLTYANKIPIAFMPFSFEPMVVPRATAKDVIQFGDLCQRRAGEVSQGVEE